MKIESINKDIDLLKKALNLVIKTENYMHFNKSSLVSDLAEQIARLEDKKDKQLSFLNSL